MQAVNVRRFATQRLAHKIKVDSARYMTIIDI